MINLFNVEEQNVINKITEGVLVATFSKDDLLQHVNFALAIIDGEDSDDLIEIYNGLKSKLLKMTETTWNDVREFLPFHLAYSEDDDTTDEDVIVEGVPAQ